MGKFHSVKTVDLSSQESFEAAAENLLDLGYKMQDFHSYMQGDYPDYTLAYVAVFVKEQDTPFIGKLTH